MDESKLVEKALEIALRAHKGQKDKYGKAYILHPVRVGMRGDSTEEKIAGFLHDVVEDSDISLDDLKEAGFPAPILEAVELLTKPKGADYFEYLKKLKPGSLAAKVKLNDLQDNMDIRRMDKVREKDIERLNKYLKAYRILKGSE